MKQKKVISLAVVAVLGVGYAAWSYLSGPPSPAALAQTALTDRDALERKNAVVTLAMRRDPEVGPLLKRLAKESKDPEVVFSSVAALGASGNGHATDAALAALDHPEKKVREVGFEVLKKMRRIDPEEFDFKPDDPEEVRSPIAKRLQVNFGTVDASTAPAVAMAPRPKDAPTPPKESPSPIKETPAAVKDTPTTEAPKPAAASVSTPSVAPVPAAPAAVVREYPAIQLLVVVFQVLAVIVLGVVVLGALSLFIGEKPAAPLDPAHKDAPLTQEEAAKMLSRGNAPNLWTKVALLVAGAVCVVALLAGAEMLRLAVRMEQNGSQMDQRLDYISSKMR